MYFNHNTNQNSQWFVWVLKGIVVFGFLVIIARLLDLQVIRGAYYTSLADTNRVRRIPILAPRGDILARNGEKLVESMLSKDSDAYIPNSQNVIVPWTRSYAGSAFGHVLGYLGYVKADEVGKARGDCLDKGVRKSGAFVGRTGLEEQYECELSGIDGEELFEADAAGEIVRSLGRKEPLQGATIQTTLDYGLQKKAAEALGSAKGAVVAMDTKGEILALYSSPSYDPSIFIQKNKSDEVRSVLQNAEMPLFNRAIGGMFHPGSIYKPLIALAALEEGSISKDYTYDDQGYIGIDSNYGNYTFNNWYFTQYNGKEGVIDVKRALARSTDTFFYEMGDLMGIEKIVWWTKEFGLGSKTGIDLPGEIAGLVPSPEWKLKTKGERWFLGNTYHLSIGQGDLAVTPLAITTALASLASDGEICVPHIVQSEAVCRQLSFTEAHLQTIKEGMEDACEPGGTAFPFFDFEPKVACKTGTAETEGGDDGDTHAWFTVFAPSEKTPEIVLTVLVERGGEGSKVASPIAKTLLEYWFYEKNGLAVPTKSITASITPTPLPGTAE